MFDLLSSHIEPGFKKCFSAYKSANNDSTRSPIVRLSFAPFHSEKDFENRCLNIAFTDEMKLMTSGQTHNGISLIIANDFGAGGQPIEKHFIKMIDYIIKENNWKVYPSPDIPESFFKKLKEVRWPDGVDIAEPDYVTLLHTILATKKAFGENLLSLYFDWEYDEGFNQFFKYYHIDITDNPENAVLVTNKFIDDNRAKEIVEMKPRTVISFKDGTVDDYNSDGPMGRLKFNNIHLVPSGITQIGNTMVADNYINDLRSTEETFKLIETVGDRVETLWKMALESRINFNDLVTEITKARIASNRFKLQTFGVGHNTYKA